MTRRSVRGFTILELAVVLIIVLILASLFPIALNQVSFAKYTRAEKDAVAMANGLFGSRDANGMLGDLGYLPDTNGLWELAKPRSEFGLRGNLRGVSYGWNGPYAIPCVSCGGVKNGLVMNPWNGAWVMQRTVVDGETYATVATAGPSGSGFDDISQPESPTAGVVGSLLVNVVDPNGMPLSYLDAKVLVSNPSINGLTMVECDATHWVATQCLISGLFQGQHAVTAIGKPLDWDGAGSGNGRWAGMAGFERVYVGAGGISTVTVPLKTVLSSP